MIHIAKVPTLHLDGFQIKEIGVILLFLKKTLLSSRKSSDSKFISGTEKSDGIKRKTCKIKNDVIWQSH